MISAIIMASGFSRRMGENKLKLSIDGKEMYKYTLDLVAKSKLEPKILVTNDEEILAYGKKLGLSTYENPLAQEGKSGSITIGVENTPKEVEGYMFFVCDQPFVSLETLEAITAAFRKNPDCIAVPFYEGKRGAPMLFPSKYREGLLSLTKDQGGVVLLKGAPVTEVAIPRGWEHIDIDTPKDYREVHHVL